MKKRKKGRGSTLGFEILERRRLLAADFGASLAPVDIDQPDQVQIATELQSCEAMDGEFDIEAGSSDQIPVVVEAHLPGGNQQLETGTTEMEFADTESTTAIGEPVESELETTPDPKNLDLGDGMDGYFGLLSPESPTETLTFSPTADGMATIVMASSFEGSQIQMSVFGSDGSVTEMISDSDSGFDTLSFDVAEGENYEITIGSTEDVNEGQFQLTVGFEKFVDQHANEIGDESTELNWTDNQTELEGKLESPGDIDTFKATAPSTGEITLNLDELVDGRRVDLEVKVMDAVGDLLVEGSTNEFLRISFDAIESEEFFITVNAAENQKGDYKLSLALEPSESPTDVANENLQDSTDQLDLNDPEVDSNEAVVEVIDETDASEATSEPASDVTFVDPVSETPGVAIPESTTDTELVSETESVQESTVELEPETELSADTTLDDEATNQIDFVDCPVVEAVTESPIEPEVVGEATLIEDGESTEVAEATANAAATPIENSLGNSEPTVSDEVEGTSSESPLLSSPVVVEQLPVDEPIGHDSSDQGVEQVAPASNDAIGLAGADELIDSSESPALEVCDFGTLADEFFADLGAEIDSELSNQDDGSTLDLSGNLSSLEYLRGIFS